MVENVLQNLIRVGRVSSINPEKATVRVLFEDKDNLVSYDLPVIVPQTMKNKDYYMPDIGEQVLCIFLPNGIQEGFCLGSFYSEKDKPAENNPNIRGVTFEDGSKITFNRKTKTLEVYAKGVVNIKAAGGVNITGDLHVDGNIDATGSIIDTTGNTSHHTH
jgi:phage baseplate assembly protein V